MHGPSSAIPGLPGAQTTASTAGERAQRPRQRVLPTARADDEDVHAARGGARRVWSRAGPTDTKLTCTPVNCSMKRT